MARSGYDEIFHKIYMKATQLSYQESMQHSIPTMFVGDTSYDQRNCIALVIKKLREKHFDVKFVKPNCLIITNLLKEKLVKGKKINDPEILRILEKYT